MFDSILSDIQTSSGVDTDVTLYLATDTSFIEIGVCYQELSCLEFNIHYRYFRHSVLFIYFFVDLTFLLILLHAQLV